MIARLGALGLLAVSVTLSACDLSSADATPAPLHAAAAVPSSACPGAQGYQHATLGYRVCYPAGWVMRDYTAEPGGGGALSVVAFGPQLPLHVPNQAGFEPPLDVRVVAGAKEALEASLTQGNQVTSETVAGQVADRISVTQDGPAMGELIVILQHDANTYALEKAPGDAYQAEFDAFVHSFVFAQPSG
ncbi:MAG TPA: hypothetical protein VET65_03470 [Candidatus Limnocylindrales bacterium]|nr:hypothetical protein [Candidatus Limnocylindrales bacterium]